MKASFMSQKAQLHTTEHNTMSKITSVWCYFLSLDLRVGFVKYQTLWWRVLKLIRGKIRKWIQILFYDLFYDADSILDQTTLSVQKTGHGRTGNICCEDVIVWPISYSIMYWGLRDSQKISGTLVNVPVRCEMRNSRILAYSDTATLIRSVIRDYVWTCGCKHELIYCPLYISVDQNVSYYDFIYRLELLKIPFFYDVAQCRWVSCCRNF
jgi:hypothetical protein